VVRMPRSWLIRSTDARAPERRPRRALNSSIDEIRRRARAGALQGALQRLHDHVERIAIASRMSAGADIDRAGRAESSEAAHVHRGRLFVGCREGRADRIWDLLGGRSPTTRLCTFLR